MYNEKSKEIYLQKAIWAFYKENSGEKAYQKAYYDLSKHFYSLNISKLYKYRSDTTLDRDSVLFANDQIWISSMDTLNDPFEFAISLDEKILNQKMPFFNDMDTYMQLKNNIKNLFEEFLKYRSKCSVFSMCQSNYNLLLWSHYANSHKGYCIEYNSIDILKQFRHFLLPVIYQENYLQAGISDIANPVAPFKLAIKSITTKSIEWKYEQEWRIVRTCQSGDKSEHTSEFPKPTAVYLGCNADCMVQSKLLELCRQKQIPVYRMQKSPVSYSIYPQRLNG